MKKILIMAMLLPTMLFAQEETPTVTKDVKKHTLSGNINISEPSTIGISFEYNAEKDFESYLINISAGSLTVDLNGYDVSGNGFVIESGGRKYFDKKYSGFYGENFLSYGSIDFDEYIPLVGNISSKYSYFSMFDSNFGYKWNVGKFSIDPSIGYIWKWEIQNDGFENRDVDNFNFKFGVKVGYRF